MIDDTSTHIVDPKNETSFTNISLDLPYISVYLPPTPHELSAILGHILDEVNGIEFRFFQQNRLTNQIETAKYVRLFIHYWMENNWINTFLKRIICL